jgi:cytochrome c5
MFVGCGCERQPQNSTGSEPVQPSVMPAADQLLLASAKVALPTGVRPEDLPDPQSSGAKMLQTFCATCHALPSPAMHSATDWPGVVRRMWLRMDLLNPQHRVPTPELGERIVLLDYLNGHALKVSKSALPDTPEREFFQNTCAQCHELPDPRQHSAQDWYVVVRRMNQHMSAILGKELTNEEIEQIVRYLGRASA